MSRLEDVAVLLAVVGGGGRARRRPSRTRRPCGRGGWRRRRRRGSCWGRRWGCSARSGPARCTTSTLRGSRPSRRRRGRPAGCPGCPRGRRRWPRRRGPGWRRCCRRPSGPRAPRATRVSMRTAVCTVMCREPVTRAPASGWASAYSLRIDIRPGISCSARVISLRPKAARERSATLKSVAVDVVIRAAPRWWSRWTGYGCCRGGVACQKLPDTTCPLAAAQSVGGPLSLGRSAARDRPTAISSDVWLRTNLHRTARPVRPHAASAVSARRGVWSGSGPAAAAASL